MFVRNALQLRGQPVVHFVDLDHPGRDPRSSRMLMKHVVPESGVLHAYAALPINAFNHFGVPFDTLRQKPQEVNQA